MSSADWVLDMDELKSLFNEKTKAIIINNPNNPLGKVFTKQELEQIAALCIKWNTLCISDEVYEWLIYKPNVHTRIGEFRTKTKRLNGLKKLKLFNYERISSEGVESNTNAH